MMVWPILGHFLCSVVSLVTLSSPLNTLETNPKRVGENQLNPKIPQISQVYKIQKNP